MQQFRFECQPGCTNCCQSEGDVHLREEDMARAAAFLNMTAELFEARYIVRMEEGAQLRMEGARCPFLEARGCAIHPVKPTQCRLYPFWPEIVETRQAWHRTAKSCPGIGKGPWIQIEDAVRIASEMKKIS